MKPTRSCDVYIDGASRGNPGPAAVGVVFFDLPAPGSSRQAGDHAKPIREFRAYLGETTNNVAEYLALLYAMQEATQLGLVALRVKTDSELLARHITGQYRVRDPQLRLFYDVIRHHAKGFQEFSITHVPRTDNRFADRLANQALDEHAMSRVLSQPSTAS